MFRGKNYKESSKLIDKQALYDPQEALKLVISASKAKFDETVELHVKLGVDGRHADQQVRGAIVLPNGTGKSVRVLCFCKPERVDEALEAGADYAGGMDLVEKIQKENWFEFDTVIASPDMMGTVGRLGKILGPRGLMPNPKTGTVTMDVAKAVKDIKGGKIEFRVDKNGNLSFLIGKMSFDESALDENFKAVADEVKRLKPSTVKGRYVTKATITSTMNPGVPVDPAVVA